jgi:hypothetical protein
MSEAFAPSAEVALHTAGNNQGISKCSGSNARQLSRAYMNCVLDMYRGSQGLQFNRACQR